jgi:hypothetical protein
MSLCLVLALVLVSVQGDTRARGNVLIRVVNVGSLYPTFASPVVILSLLYHGENLQIGVITDVDNVYLATV